MSHTKKKTNGYEDCYIYILLLTTLVILLKSLKTYTFNIFNIDLTYSLFLLPVVYLIVNYITKKYDYKKAIAAIAISGVISVCFTVLISFALGRQISLSSVSGEFCGYVISQFVNLTIYTFLLNNTKSPYFLIFLNYMFSLIVYYMFYTLIYLNMIILDNFWEGYLITIFIQTIICLVLAYIDKRIKRGKDIIK
jgi:uncharacterized PurR-regulated membrane protein YhhQ (DUF165 family)